MRSGALGCLLPKAMGEGFIVQKRLGCPGILHALTGQDEEYSLAREVVLSRCFSQMVEVRGHDFLLGPANAVGLHDECGRGQSARQQFRLDTFGVARREIDAHCRAVGGELAQLFGLRNWRFPGQPGENKCLGDFW